MDSKEWVEEGTRATREVLSPQAYKVSDYFVFIVLFLHLTRAREEK